MSELQVTFGIENMWINLIAGIAWSTVTFYAPSPSGPLHGAAPPRPLEPRCSWSSKPMGADDSALFRGAVAVAPHV